MIRRTWIVLSVMGIVGCLVAWAAGQADEDFSRTVVLVEELSKASAAVMTPSQKLPERANKWSTHGVPPTVTIAGHDIVLEEGSSHFGADMDGDGNVTAKESLTKGGREGLPFRIRIEDGPDGEKRYIGLYMMGPHRIGKDYHGSVAPLSCKKAVIDGQVVRIFDDNLDGAYTTDGKDAIIIGDSAKMAVPFYSAQKIGESFYDVTIESDGSALTLTRVEAPTATVELATKVRSIRAFVITDGARVYDLTQVSEILPGKYKLFYGIVASRKDYPILVVPSDMSVTYDVQADKINQLRVAEPLWIWYAGGVNGRYVSVNETKIMGSGGEHYLVSFHRNTASIRLTVFKGKKVYVSGDVQSVESTSGSFGGEANIDIPHDAEVHMATSVKGLGKAELRTNMDAFSRGECPVNVAEEPVIYEVRY